MDPPLWSDDSTRVGNAFNTPGCAVEPGPSIVNGHSPGIFNLINFLVVSTQL